MKRRLENVNYFVTSTQNSLTFQYITCLISLIIYLKRLFGNNSNIIPHIQYIPIPHLTSGI